MKKLTLVVVALFAFGGCKKKSSEGAGAAIAKMTAFKDEMCNCKDAKCAQDVSDRIAKWSAEQPKDQEKKMSEADNNKAKLIGDEIGKCQEKAMAASAPPTTGSAAAPAGSAGSGMPEAALPGLPPECADYKAQVEKIKPCDKLPPKAKEALIKAYNDASAGWANMPEGARAGLDKSCKAGTQAIVDAAKEACGW